MPSFDQNLIHLMSSAGHDAAELKALALPNQISSAYETNGKVECQSGAAAKEKKPLPHHDQLILVVDDHSTNAKLASFQLKKLGYPANCVSDGWQALQEAAARSYSLILMDCQMPELDGFESTEAIRKLEESTGKFVPIIAMTAELSNEAREHCFASGMNDCVTKPVTLEKLAAVLQKWLAN